MGDLGWWVDKRDLPGVFSGKDLNISAISFGDLGWCMARRIFALSPVFKISWIEVKARTQTWGKYENQDKG
jgi:hypothetical protein